MQLIEEVNTFADMSSNALPASAVKLQQIKTAHKEDEVCAEIRRYCHEGWPALMSHTPLPRPYWESRSHLATIGDLLLYDERIVIPRCMRLETFKIIHEGHLGISKCRVRANTAVWWPGLSKEIYKMVSTCHTCAKVRPEPKETLVSASVPSRPRERVGMDLFEFNGRLYLVIVDYYSRWIEFRKLTSLTSEHTIVVMKEVFATHGIPDVIMSDNGPQFSAEAFAQFAKSYGFTHTTSSPRYPQANGEAERAVRTLKEILKKNYDPYLALLTQRTTPLLNGLSPNQLLKGRRMRNRLPVIPSTLQPGVQERDIQKAKEREDAHRENQQRQFNNRHRARYLPLLLPGDNVWVSDQDRYGTIVQRAPQPRSYLVKTPKGTIRRNRTALVPAENHQHDNPSPTPIVPEEPGNPPATPSRSTDTTMPSTTPIVPEEPGNPPATPSRSTDTTMPSTTQESPGVMRTRSGRLVNPPSRLNL